MMHINLNGGDLLNFEFEWERFASKSPKEPSLPKWVVSLTCYPNMTIFGQDPACPKINDWVNVLDFRANRSNGVYVDLPTWIMLGLRGEPTLRCVWVDTHPTLNFRENLEVCIER